VPEFLAARARGDLGIERAFFAGLLLRSGVYKTTVHHRVDDLLPPLIEHARMLGADPLRVLDVACSSGVSTVEMHRALVAAGIPTATTGTDLVLDADHVQRADGCAMLFDSAGGLLQVEIGSWASLWRWRPRDRVFRPWLAARARRLVARECEAFRAARGAPSAGFKVTRLALLSSDALAADGVRFVEEDILVPKVPGPFELIRVANLLHLNYFAPDQVRRMVSALSARLVDGGLLVIARSEGTPPLNRATLFRRRGTGLEVVLRIEGGSEISDLVAGPP